MVFLESSLMILTFPKENKCSTKIRKMCQSEQESNSWYAGLLNKHLIIFCSTRQEDGNVFFFKYNIHSHASYINSLLMFVTVF